VRRLRPSVTELWLEEVRGMTVEQDKSSVRDKVRR